MWNMIHNPSKCTIEMILKLIFNARSYSPRELEKCRYFFIAASNLFNSMSSSQHTSQTTRPVCEHQGQSRANSMIETIRNAKVVNLGVQENFEDDYVPLPSDDDSSDNSSVQSKVESLSCPHHIDDMMTIVRKLRSQKYVVTDSALPSSLSSSFTPSLSSNHNHISPQPDRSSIYDAFNLANLFTFN